MRLKFTVISRNDRMKTSFELGHHNILMVRLEELTIFEFVSINCGIVVYIDGSSGGCYLPPKTRPH